MKRNYVEACAEFLHTGNIPPSFEKDIFCLQQLELTIENKVNEFMCWVLIIIFLSINTIV